MKQVVCHKCRCPNQFGAVFCRNCGAKLKFSEKEFGIKKEGKIGKIFIRFLKLAIFLAIVVVIGMIFIPWGLSGYPEVKGTEQMEKADELCNNIDITILKEESNLFKITPAQATYAANFLSEQHAMPKVEKKAVATFVNAFNSRGGLGKVSMGGKSSLGKSGMGSSGGLSKTNTGSSRGLNTPKTSSNNTVSTARDASRVKPNIHEARKKLRKEEE
ncbi:MAG: zinc ribbon domain-containing protein [Lentisphaerae bacterium]|nr:zinc ribbon domain-containing protein [Lentisphaerota bacterium]MCP4103136.1 zinc ribbon domain-containing protein [Lentisphaerota bacterium]